MRFLSGWTTLAVWLSVGVAAKTVHVDNVRGDDGRAGLAPEQALASIAAGVRLLEPGDTLTLADTGESYRESIVLGRGGEPGAPLVIEGNGASVSGLKPIPADKWVVQEDGTWFFAWRRSGSLRPYLVEGGKPVPRASRREDLGPGQAYWAKEGAFFRPAEGKSVTDHALEATLRASGVAVTSASYITVRNLTAEFFANDGFNVHGECRGLVFRNIVGRYNGDDGFSVHEDVGSVVHGGHFYGNTYGVQDVNASRSVYNGLLVERNRIHGIDLYGGFHSLVDAVARHNGKDQVRISPGRAPHIGLADENPICQGLVFVKNVVAHGGETALHVMPNARAAVHHCVFAGSDAGIVLEQRAVCHVTQSVAVDCGSAELRCASEEVMLDSNAYYPGRLSWLGRGFSPADWGAYREASGQDGHSVLRQPLFAGPGCFLVALPKLMAGDREVAPGPTRELVLRWGDEAVRNELAVGRSGHSDPEATACVYDFEAHNPWGRVYPQPSKSKAGQAVVATSELSTEQAHSGERSAKLSVALPPGPPATWLIKLFSLKFSYASPVAVMRFWLFGDGSGRRFRPRVRDRSGECFYGAMQAVDWSGWRQIAWDLAATPPVSIAHGDGNRQQDCPPIEIVLEIYAERQSEADGTFVLYVDDLELELQR